MSNTAKFWTHVHAVRLLEELAWADVQGAPRVIRLHRIEYIKLYYDSLNRALASIVVQSWAQAAQVVVALVAIRPCLVLSLPPL